ncbi:hypothetical protein ANN_25423, partial [Periplaneta americana]
SARNEQQIAILRDVSGKFRSGRLTAVLGPSGAGKSSLLNVLSGFKINGVTGCILVNGVERDLEEFGRQCCYITQDCYLMDLLTTRETLAVAASFKLNPKIGKQERNVMVTDCLCTWPIMQSQPIPADCAKINDILELLGLRKAAHTRVGNLSGGEKKRLSIAQELITNPPVMFFDEPTSGLDSSSSLQVISHLKSLAQGGRTVVCTIHQPSSRLFEMFDDLYILAEGQCLYNGAVNDMTSVFEEAGFQCPKYYNRADFAIEVACRERGANIEKLVAKNEKEAFANEKEDPDGVIGEQTTMLRPSLHTAVQVAADSLGSRYPISVWRQICVLLRRSVLCTVRDLHLAQLRLAAHVVVGLFLGGVYYGIGDEASKVPSNTACLMFFMMFLFFCNLFPFVHSFPVEKLVVMREHLNNWYSLEAYHISKLIAELPLQPCLTSQSSIEVALLCAADPVPHRLPAVGLLPDRPAPDGTRFIQFWAVYVLLAALAQSLGLVTGAAVEPQCFRRLVTFLDCAAAGRVRGVRPHADLFFLVLQTPGNIPCLSVPQLGVFVVSVVSIPMLLFSGFYLRLRDIHVCLQWLSYVTFFRYGFEATMQCVYGYGRASLKCSEAYCHFKSPRKYLEEFGMEHSNYWFDLLGLAVWIVALQVALHLILRLRLKISR